MTNRIEASGEGRHVWFSVPLWVRAAERAFELHVGRDATTKPIEALWQSPSGPRALPEAAVRSWRGWGLSNFFDLTVKDQTGRKIRHRRVPWCPNGFGRIRITPDAEATRYPDVCGGNPFTRYQVWGIERGWATSAEIWLTYRLRPGVYSLEVRIPKAYREALGLGPTLQTYALTVAEPGDGSGPGPKPPRPIARRAMPHATPPGGPISTGRQRPDVVTNATPDPSTVSDLAALPAWQIRVQHEAGRQWLTFAATVWNAGPAPLIVDGFRRGEALVMDAYQTFTDANGDAVGYADVGTMEYDPRPGHTHWHFLDFAQYRLLAGDDGTPVRSEKEAFCLAPTDAEDLLVPRATWRPDSIGFSQCGWEESISIREVLPAGWGDTYLQSVPGQSFDVTDLPDGEYVIEVTANPERDLYDATTANDRALRSLTLSTDDFGNRIATVPPHLGPL